MRITQKEPPTSTRAGDFQSPSRTLRTTTGRRLQVAGTSAIVLLAAALLCAQPAFAQVKTAPNPAKAPTPPPPPVAPRIPVPVDGATGLPVPTAPPAAPAPRKLALFETEACPLEAAVQHLQTQLQLNKMEPLNILFGPDTKDLDVANLSLRNVSGADALQFLATSAGCTVEPMYSTESSLVFVGGSIQGQKPPVIGYTFRAKPKPTPQGMVSIAGPQPMPGGRPAPAASPTGRLTRIYPLGAVSTATKFPDLEKTLREIFKADGVAENHVSLALHEKTNVLVVNAAEPVHALVEQLLTALNTNTSQADRQNSARDRAMGREELESAVRAQKRLLEELAERDALMRELQRELRQLQNPAPKTPSAK